MKQTLLLMLVLTLQGCATGLTAGCDRMCQRASQNATVQPRWHQDSRDFVVTDLRTGHKVMRIDQR